MKLTRVNKILKLFKIPFICFFIFLNLAAFSQDQPPKSSTKKNTSPTKTEKEILKITNDYIAKKEYDKAFVFLSKYYKEFSESLHINWLYAHLLFINNNKIAADKTFQKAISISPRNKNLQKDYARFLYQTGKIDEAASILSEYMDEDSNDIEFLLIQANISYWNGDIKNARKKINQIEKFSPNTTITKNLSKQINDLGATYIKTNFQYEWDTQPLDFFASHISISEYVSKFLQPHLEISKYNFHPQKEGALIAKLSNQFQFHKLKLKANITGGIYINHSDSSDWLGGINLVKQITKNATLTVGYEKNSLLGTIASTTFNLTQQDVFGTVDYQNKFIILNAGYNHKFFKDANYIKSIGSWIVSQPIKFQKLNFQVGYGYSYTDAKNILFIYDDQKVGVYNPYFTPKDQQIHAGLFIVNYKPLDNLTFEAKVSYGFIATVKNPYPVQINATDYEIGGFYDETFTPSEVNGSINYTFSDSFGMQVNYTFQETFFYKRNNINLGLNYKF